MQLKKELKEALISSLLGKYALYVFQILSLMILARVFNPEVFGLIAVTQVFIMFFQMLATSGLGPAIVYKESISKDMLNGVFTFTLILGSALAIVFFFISDFLYQWLDLSSGLTVFYLMAPTVFFSSLCIVPLACLQKDAQFKTIARAEIFAEFLALVACLLLLQVLDAENALASKFVCVAILRFVFYYLFSRKTTLGTPNFGSQVRLAAPLFAFAKYQLGFNILNFFSRNLDNLLVAKYFGVASLGVYEKTYQVMKYPLQLFTFAITPALQPIFTRYKDDKSIVCHEYAYITEKLGLLGAFSAFILFWAAEPVVYILFGEKWHESAQFLRILSLSIPIQMVLSSTGGVFQAFGETKALFKCGLFGTSANVSAIILGIMSDNLSLLCFYLIISFSLNFVQCFFTMFYTVFTFKELGKMKRSFIFVAVPFINFLFIDINFQVVLDLKDAFIRVSVIAFLSAIALVVTYIVVYPSSGIKNLLKR